MELGDISKGTQHRQMICSLCYDHIEDGFGHNGWPLVKDGNGRVCKHCNETKVIPARIAGFKEDRRKKGRVS